MTKKFTTNSSNTNRPNTTNTGYKGQGFKPGSQLGKNLTRQEAFPPIFNNIESKNNGQGFNPGAQASYSFTEFSGNCDCFCGQPTTPGTQPIGSYSYNHDNHTPSINGDHVIEIDKKREI